MRPRDDTGQSTAEYTGLLALVAAVMIGAGALIGLHTIGDAVAATVRTGICIVAGDVCRSSDAEAAGLAPCTVGERSLGGGRGVTIAVFRFGENDEWTAASRSDGSVLVTRTGKDSAGLTAGLGVEASPVGLKLGVKGKAELALTDGRAWEFPDAASARRFVENHDEDRVPPTYRFGEAGALLGGSVNASAAGVTVTAAEATAEGAAGAKVGRGRTTLYMRTRLRSVATAWLPGKQLRAGGPLSGDAVTELAFEGGAPREIAFRRVERGPRSGQVTEWVTRLDLRDPANRAAATRLLSVRLPWTVAVASSLNAVARHAARAGTVERSIYAVRDESENFSMAVRVGAGLGIEASKIDIDKRLVAASAWTPGSQERVREDCVM